MIHQLEVYRLKPIEGNIHPDFTQGGLCASIDATKWLIWLTSDKKIVISSIWNAINQGALEAILMDQDVERTRQEAQSAST